MSKGFIFYICDKHIVWSINRKNKIISQLQQLDSITSKRETLFFVDHNVLTVIYPALLSDIGDDHAYKKWSLDLTSEVSSTQQINRGAPISNISYNDGLLLTTLHGDTDTALYLQDYNPLTPTCDYDESTFISLGI